MYHAPIFFDCQDLVLRYKAKNKDVILGWVAREKLPAFKKCAYKGIPLWYISEIKEWEAQHARTLCEFRKLLRMKSCTFKKARKLLANSEGVSK